MGANTVLEYLKNAEMPASGKTFIIPGVGALLCWGPEKPADNTPGYAPGCLFLHTDGGAGSALYCNEGTFAACDFDLVTVA